MENESTQVIFPFLVIFLVSAVIGAGVLLIYFLVYKSAINKTVTAQSQGTKQHKMPAPSSAAKTVVMVAFAVLIAAVWLDIRSIKEETSNIYSGLAQQIQGLESKVGYLEGVIDSVSDELKREQSLFTSIDLSFGEINSKNHSVKITVSAAPKSCTDEAKISIWLDDRSVNLAKIGTGLYSGEIEVDLYKGYTGTALISVTDEGKTVSEELDINVYDIREKYGAVISSQFENWVDCEYRSGRLDMKIHRLVRGTGETEEFFVRDSFKLVVEVEGSVVLEDSLSLPDSYSDNIFTFEFEKSCEIPNNAYTDIYISAVDKCGNTHKCMVLSNEIPEAGYLTIGFGGEERVYDSTGNLIGKF